MTSRDNAQDLFLGKFEDVHKGQTKKIDDVRQMLRDQHSQNLWMGQQLTMLSVAMQEVLGNLCDLKKQRKVAGRVDENGDEGQETDGEMNWHAGEEQANNYAGGEQAKGYATQKQENGYAIQEKVNSYAVQKQANCYATQKTANGYAAHEQANGHTPQEQEECPNERQ